MGFDYEAVPWPADAPDPQPEMRAELEELGFTLLGGCRLTEADMDEVRTMAASYGERAEEFLHGAAQPGQVLAAPDGTAFVQLAWLWDCRYACFTTVLADGRVVQTQTEWGADPPWPTALVRVQRWTDRRTEQMSMVSDRHAGIVDGVAQAWDEHRRRIAQVAAPVPPHVRLEDFVEVWTAESALRGRWSRRTTWVAVAVVLALAAVTWTVVTPAVGSQPWWIDVAMALVLVALSMALHARVWVLVRRWPRTWPRFRAPVPVGAGRPHRS